MTARGPAVPPGVDVHRAPAPPLVPLFSWAGYIVAVWVGTLTGGFAWGLRPLLVSALTGGMAGEVTPDRVLEAIGVFGSLIGIGASLLALPIMVFLAPVALPTITAMRARGLVARRDVALGGMAMAALPALAIGLVDLAGDSRPAAEALADLAAAGGLGAALAGLAGYAVTLVILPGAVGGLTYRAIALRRERSRRREGVTSP